MVGVRGLEPRASCSQSRRATNCATPGYEIFQLWSNMWSTPIFDQLPARWKVLSAQLSQGFPGFPRTTARAWASSSQSKRATNCATPGYEVVRRSGRILLNCAILSHMELENSMGIQTSSAVLDWSMCWYMQDWIFISIPLSSPGKYPLAKPEDIFLQFEPYSCRRRSTTE